MRFVRFLVFNPATTTSISELLARQSDSSIFAFFLQKRAKEAETTTSRKAGIQSAKE